MTDANSRLESSKEISVSTFESYYPSTYFHSNPVISKNDFLHWSIAYFVICLISIGCFLLLPTQNSHPLKWITLIFALLTVGWVFSYFIFREYKYKDFHEGNSTSLSSPCYDIGTIDRIVLELWSDCIIVRIGDRHWMVKDNLRSIDRIDPHGKFWQVTFVDGNCFPLRTDLLTDLQSSYITSRVDLKAQIEINREKIRKALEAHLQRPDSSSSSSK